MIKVYDTFNENDKNLPIENILHFTYLHGKVDSARGCDLFGVLMTSIDPARNIYYNYARGSKSKYRVFVEDIDDLVKVARLTWFPVEVADYEGKCICILKEWRYEENIKHSGIIVDISEWEEGLRYVKEDVCEGPEFPDDYWEQAKIKIREYIEEIS